jgi:ankyrin repeat protein
LTANPKLLALLALVILGAVALKLANPDRKYSTRQFWERATVATVADVPQRALVRGNRNGGVLMWAAMGARDPAIVEALVARGAGINEANPTFGGTPLSAAAGKSAHPEMIGTLVRLGAHVNQRVNNGETPAMVAAQYNRTPGIIEALDAAHADFEARSTQGKTALDFAREAENAVVEQALLARRRPIEARDASAR